MTTKHYCGLDFHKNFTQICIMNKEGHLITEERIRTPLLVTYMSNKDYIIGIEASGGVFDIAEKLENLGHIVRIINPSQFKAIGIGGKKTDRYPRVNPGFLLFFTALRAVLHPGGPDIQHISL